MKYENKKEITYAIIQVNNIADLQFSPHNILNQLQWYTIIIVTKRGRMEILDI